MTTLQKRIDTEVWGMQVLECQMQTNFYTHLSGQGKMNLKKREKKPHECQK